MVFEPVKTGLGLGPCPLRPKDRTGPDLQTLVDTNSSLLVCFSRHRTPLSGVSLQVPQRWSQTPSNSCHIALPPSPHHHCFRAVHTHHHLNHNHTTILRPAHNDPLSSPRHQPPNARSLRHPSSLYHQPPNVGSPRHLGSSSTHPTRTGCITSHPTLAPPH